MLELATSSDINNILTFSAACEQTQTHRRRLCSSTAVAPALQPYQNATHWPSGNPLPRHLAEAARVRRRYPNWRAPSHVARAGLALAYLGVVLCVITYGSSKRLRDPCWGLSNAVRVISFACIFCLPNALYWLLRYTSFGGKSTALEEHVRVLYLLLFLETASDEAAQGVLKQIKHKHSKTVGIDLRRISLPDLPSDSGAL